MTLQKALLATLVYHDIFGYPLTLKEAHKFLIDKKTSINDVEKALFQLSRIGKISSKNGYFYLGGRLGIVSQRISRSRHSKKKLERAAFFGQILKVIPGLKLVAVSGALAMGNSHKDDDIDLALVTSVGTLWTTRFLANLLLLPLKRDPQGQRIADRACLNIFIDESELKIRPHNLYLAHEITQLKPLWDRDGTYARFIKANSWIKKYLPNWQAGSQFTVHSSQKKKPSTVNRQPSTVEKLLRSFQLAYMRSKITTEKIGKTQLFFHPTDTQKWVIGEYQKRLKTLDIKPT